jgi:hypothetical protein
MDVSVDNMKEDGVMLRNSRLRRHLTIILSLTKKSNVEEEAAMFA